MNTPRRAALALAHALCGGLALLPLTGCQTEGGFGATMADVRDSISDAIGIEPAATETKSTVKAPLQELAQHQKAARDQVQLAYNELDQLSRVPEGDLDAQHAAYTQAVQEIRDQAGVTTRLRGEARGATDAFTTEAARTLTNKVSNPSLRRVAQRNIDAFKTSAADAVAQTGRYDVDLNPLLSRFDQQAATLKQGATEQSVGEVRAEMGSLKTDVEGVLSGLDQQVAALEALIDQADAVDTSLRAAGL